MPQVQSLNYKRPSLEVAPIRKSAFDGLFIPERPQTNNGIADGLNKLVNTLSEFAKSMSTGNNKAETIVDKQQSTLSDTTSEYLDKNEYQLSFRKFNDETPSQLPEPHILELFPKEKQEEYQEEEHKRQKEIKRLTNLDVHFKREMRNRKYKADYYQFYKIE